MLAGDVMLANTSKNREQWTISNAHAVFFDSLIITLTCYFRVHRAGSQLKKYKKIYWIFGRLRPVPEYSFQVTLIVTNCSKVTVYM